MCCECPSKFARLLRNKHDTHVSTDDLVSSGNVVVVVGGLLYFFKFIFLALKGEIHLAHVFKQTSICSELKCI